MTDRVRIGHWTREDGRTGCSVLLFDDLTPAVVDVRGGAPGTRETDLLQSGSLVGKVDAIVLTGGSAFGLAAADGVMRYLRERGRGFQTSAGPVPIVSAAVLFDLDSGRFQPPDAESGYAACVDSGPLPDAFAGRDGAGAGATFRKLWGPQYVSRAGLAAATVRSETGSVTAVVALNALGAAACDEQEQYLTREILLSSSHASLERESTTLGVIIVDDVTDRELLARCAIAAHDGLSRSIVPSHTIHDGDLFFAVGLDTGTPVDSARMKVPIAAELAVERAISAIAALPAT